jgi:hypothetical protein
MKKHLELLLRVNKQAGSEAFYQKSQELGILAAQSFREVRGAEKQRHRSQMTGLEHIAETTMKVTDVLDYIKKQTARQEGWKKEVGEKKERFGECLKTYIESGLEPYIQTVCQGFINATTNDGKYERQEVYLHLIRQCIRQLVVRYEYQIEEKVSQ